MNIKLKDKLFRERGQTLNEAMVAISILTIGVIGILGGITKSVAQSSILADRMTAVFLASEGIEVAKNIVDSRSANNYITGVDPNGSKWNSDFVPNRWYFSLDFKDIDTIQDTEANNYLTLEKREDLDVIPDFEIANLPSLKLNKDGFLSYDGDTETSFKRLVGVTSVNNQHMKIISRVYWKSRRNTWLHTTLETDLLNWR